MRYPHYSLGQVSGFIGQNLQFHQLTFEQFMAGELATITATTDRVEREGRIELLQRISLWRLRSNIAWPQIRNTYAHIIRRIENRELTWRADWDRFEQHIYDKVMVNQGNVKSDKTKKAAQSGSSDVWFCKQYQKIEGCPKDSPHGGIYKNSYKSMLHICATCWLKDRVKRNHPECSSDCPHKDN